MADEDEKYPVLNGTGTLVVTPKGTSKIVMNEGERSPITMKLKAKLRTRTS